MVNNTQMCLFYCIEWAQKKEKIERTWKGRGLAHSLSYRLSTDLIYVASSSTIQAADLWRLQTVLGAYGLQKAGASELSESYLCPHPARGKGHFSSGGAALCRIPASQVKERSFIPSSLLLQVHGRENLLGLQVPLWGRVSSYCIPSFQKGAPVSPRPPGLWDLPLSNLWIWLKNKVSAVCKETCPPYLGLVKLCNLRHNIFVYKIPRWLWKMWKEKGQTFKKWKKRKQPIILPLGGPLLTFYVHISRFYHGNTYLLHIHELPLVSCSLTLLQFAEITKISLPIVAYPKAAFFLTHRFEFIIQKEKLRALKWRKQDFLDASVMC